MNDSKKDVVIIEPDYETAKRFEETHTISDDAMKQAEQFMDEMKQEYAEDISKELHDIKTLYSNFRMANGDDRDEVMQTLNRQVLKVKSNAGMFGYELLTRLCELLFELLDDNYDVNRERVEKSIELYINTLYIVYRRGLADNMSEDAKRLIDELVRLNKSLKSKKS